VTGSAVAMNVCDGSATSSPGPTPSASRTTWIAAVPEPTPMAWRAHGRVDGVAVPPVRGLEIHQGDFAHGVWSILG
jgi:hypothetical protein